jgi:hypothetical protein
MTPAKMKPGTSSKNVKHQKSRPSKPIMYRKNVKPHVEIEYEYEPIATKEESKSSY